MNTPTTESKPMMIHINAPGCCCCLWTKGMMSSYTLHLLRCEQVSREAKRQTKARPQSRASNYESSGKSITRYKPLDDDGGSYDAQQADDDPQQSDGFFLVA